MAIVYCKQIIESYFDYYIHRAANILQINKDDCIILHPLLPLHVDHAVDIQAI
jgi:hypothetical protein